MRVYFEKPRTTVGWKGFINDPHLDGSFAINEGLRLARKLLLEINRMGLPCGHRVPRPALAAVHLGPHRVGRDRRAHHGIADAPPARLGPVVPGGIQERHRRLHPVAVDALRAAAAPHAFMGMTKTGQAAIFETVGNEDCHVILRGGKTPNYDAANVDAAAKELGRGRASPPHLMIDFSHANASKQYQKQMDVGADVARAARRAATSASWA